MHKISSKLTFTETFNLGCDTDLENNNPTFSLDTSLLMTIYIQIEFGCKRLTGLELIKDIVETVIFWLYKPTLWPLNLKIESHFFAWHSGWWWCTTIPNLVTKGCKETLSRMGNKYVSRALHPSPLKTPQCFPFSSEIIRHTQSKKRSNVAAASQLMWTGTLG